MLDHGPDPLDVLFADDPPADLPRHLVDELSHDHMLALAGMYERWAGEQRAKGQDDSRLLAWARDMRALADEVGPDWCPPEPEKLGPIGFMARQEVATRRKRPRVSIKLAAQRVAAARAR